jgi:hypothetical protein
LVIFDGVVDLDGGSPGIRTIRMLRLVHCTLLVVGRVHSPSVRDGGCCLYLHVVNLCCDFCRAALGFGGAHRHLIALRDPGWQTRV